MPAEKIIPVVMSGGAGTRLWPLSRAQKPKQFHSLAGHQSLLEETLLRTKSSLQTGVEFEAPVVICNAAHRKETLNAGQNTRAGTPRLILEPVGRNTAPAAAFAAFFVAEADPDALVLLAPADHHISDVEAFHEAIARGAKAARQGMLVTFGILPAGPETGYGYIKRGDAVDGAGSSGADTETKSIYLDVEGVHEVAAFVEKPDMDTARDYVESGDYYWNAGIFLFSPQALIAEMETHCPDILRGARKAWDEGKREEGVILLDPVAMEACPAESIDYAVMEHTDKAAVAPVDPGWNDVGSWSAVYDIAEKQSQGTACVGDVIALDVKNSLIHSSGPLVTALGVQDLVIVATKDAVFVAPRDRSQDVRDIVAKLKEEKRREAVEFIDPSTKNK